MKDMQPRAWVGVVLALEWNLPFLIFFWYDWTVFLYLMSCNCLLWSAGIAAFLFFARWRHVFFRSQDFSADNRRLTTVVSAWMLLLGAVALAGAVWRW